MKTFHYITLTCLILSGCTAVSNLDQLNELGAYSREKDAQHRDVKAIDDHFDALFKVIEHGQINAYKDEAAFVHAFGHPILKKDLNDGKERWLYRHAIFRLAKDKVYLYFDRHGMLIKWEKLPCSSLY